MVLLDILEYDLLDRKWNIKFTLPEILDITTQTSLHSIDAEKLKTLLGKIKDKEHEVIIKQILDSIEIIKTEKPKDESK